MKSLVIIALMSISGFAANAAESCNLEIARAQSLIEENGMPDNEELFLSLSESALNVCQSQAQNWESLRVTLKNAKKSCEEAANQGMSYTYRGYCYLKVASLADWILGPLSK